MRVTAGQYKNRQVKCPPGVIRPAMDRMRESMFSILGDLSGLSFLDCFSGSGLVGIEAASRGAEPIHFVEMDRGKRQVINQNLSIINEAHQLFMVSVQKYFKLRKRQFDIVYLDPPFLMQEKQKIIEAADKMEIVEPNGLLIIHYPCEDHFDEQIGALKQIDHRKYGRSELLFYQNCRI